jgi:nitrous oxide reductase
MGAHEETHAMTTRRRFIQIVPFAGAAVCGAGSALAQANLLSEKDPTAVNLGYVADATKADKAKYKQYAAGQACGNCALYQGKAGDAAAACPLFAGKVVSAKGWCSAYAKKAA